jgi:hypothetical protein
MDRPMGEAFDLAQAQDQGGIYGARIRHPSIREEEGENEERRH